MRKYGSQKHFGQILPQKNSLKPLKTTPREKEDSGKFKSFILRIRTTLILLPFGIFVVFFSNLNGFFLFLALTIVASIINFEIFNMVEDKGFRFYIWINNIGIVLSCLNFYFYGLGVYDINYFSWLQFLLFIIIIFSITLLESISGKFDFSIEHVGVSIFSFILLGIFFPFGILIKMMDLSGWILSIVLLITWLSDTGGFVFGKFFGKHHIPFLSSPNKTTEGYIGTFVFAYLITIILFFLQNIFNFSPKFSLSQFIIIATFVIFSAILGDLSESTFKRWAHKKDSGELLPGHGGFFDRFDSVIYSMPVYYLILKLMGY
ncbi:MAG: phosphatidate cytidylyltransferase [Brevinematia bacterium]